METISGSGVGVDTRDVKVIVEADEVIGTQSCFQKFWPYLVLAQSQTRVRGCSATGEMAISYENDTTHQKAPNKRSADYSRRDSLGPRRHGRAWLNG